MTVDVRRVRQVLRERLLDVDGIVPEDRWAPENRQFTPPNPGSVSAREEALWIEDATRITTEPRISTTEVQSFGRSLFLVHYPTGSGTETADEMGLLIVNDLQSIAYISSQGLVLYIDQVDRLAPREKNDVWMFLPVEVAWRAYSHETQAVS